MISKKGSSENNSPLQRGKQFIRQMFSRERSEFSRAWRIVAYQVRLCFYIGKETIRDRCLMRAAALAFTTLVSLVPFAVLAFTLFKAFKGLNEEEVFGSLSKYLVSHTETANKVYLYLRSVSDTLSSGPSNVINVLMLVAIAITLLITIEQAFNDIWNVTKKRLFWGKFTTFFTLIVLGPLLIGTSIYISTRSAIISRILESYSFMQGFSSLMVSLLSIWVVLFLAYKLLPNTRVQWKAALVGAIVAGTLWEISKYGFSEYIALFPKYWQIYGAPVSVLIFMTWLYFTWVIVLFGVEVSFTVQNLHRLHSRDWQRPTVSSVREFLAVQLVLEIARRYWHGKKPAATESLAMKFDVLEEDVANILGDLENRKILMRTDGSSYRPARPLETISLSDIAEAARNTEAMHSLTSHIEPSEKVAKLFLDAEQAREGIWEGHTIRDLLDEPKTKKLKKES